jgi:hypothetical protein
MLRFASYLGHVPNLALLARTQGGAGTGYSGEIVALARFAAKDRRAQQCQQACCCGFRDTEVPLRCAWARCEPEVIDVTVQAGVVWADADLDRGDIRIKTQPRGVRGCRPVGQLSSVCGCRSEGVKRRNERMRRGGGYVTMRVGVTYRSRIVRGSPEGQ